jgi:hypothetical protein
LSTVLHNQKYLNHQALFISNKFLYASNNVSIDIFSQKWSPPLSDLEKGVGGLHITDVTPDTVATSSRFTFTSGPETEPLVPPIYHASTYKLKSVDDYLKILEKVSFVIYSHLQFISIIYKST